MPIGQSIYTRLSQAITPDESICLVCNAPLDEVAWILGEASYVKIVENSYKCINKRIG